MCKAEEVRAAKKEEFLALYNGYKRTSDYVILVMLDVGTEVCATRRCGVEVRGRVVLTMTPEIAKFQSPKVV